MNVALGNVGESSSADSFHRPRGGPPPSKREVLGFRRSKPAALPSIGYRGFAVAPITLRASSRNIVVITVTGAAIYETGAQCAPLQGTTVQPTVAMIKPSVANASHRFDFRHVVGARIARPQTLFKPSIFHPKDLPHRGRGTALWAVEGVSRRWKEFVFRRCWKAQKNPPGGISSRRGFLMSLRD